MSQDRPPLPIQEPVVTSTADDTTQAQRRALFGASGLGHVELRQSRLGSALFSPSRYREPYDVRHKHTLAPLRLPSRPTSFDNYATGHVDKRIAISGLLSSSSSLPAEQSNERHLNSRTQHFLQSSNTAEQHQPHHDATDQSEDAITTRDRYQISSPPRAPSRSIGSPNLTRGFSQNVVSQRDNYPRCAESDHSVHSPSDTIGSFDPSYHSRSSEQSPTIHTASFYTPIATPIISHPPPELNYHLSIRQQPIAARACGYGERDRRVIDPPPILQLRITNKETGAPEQDEKAMLAVHCALFSTDGDGDQTTAVDTTLSEAPPARCLMGTLVASPYQAKDEYGMAGTFFVFSDLSCRKPGTYKLEFKMLRVDPTHMSPGNRVGVVASAESHTFVVYQAKDFPGMRASTALLTALREQGLAVGLKKGTEARISKGRKRQQSESSAESGGSESDGGRPASNGSGKQSATDRTTPKRKVQNKSKS